jgi:hypothetical protein
VKAEKPTGCYLFILNPISFNNEVWGIEYEIALSSYFPFSLNKVIFTWMVNFNFLPLLLLLFSSVSLVSSCQFSLNIKQKLSLILGTYWLIFSLSF